MKIDRRQRQNNKGMTLIALMITIIVLLILAGVSIAMLMGENGLLSKAKKAEEETRGVSVEEVVKIWKVNQEADKHGENQTAQTLEGLIKDLIEQKLLTEEERDKILGNESKGIKATYQITIGSRIIKFKEELENDKVDSSKLKIGDYVDYQPDRIATVYDKFGETYSGYANEDIGQDTTLKWRILNINEDTVDLISDRPISMKIYFGGARGYNNGVYLLNDYCKTMYSNVSKGAIARSINIEDIQDKMKIDTNIGKKAYEIYGEGKDYEYGKSKIYTINKWYPLQWKNDKGTIGESKQTDIKEYATEEEAKKQETNENLIAIATYWELDANTIKTNFESADTREESKKESIYYELLCNNGVNQYWLASRCVYIGNLYLADFGLRRINNGNVDSNSMFESNSGTNFLYRRILCCSYCFCTK